MPMLRSSQQSSPARAGRPLCRPGQLVSVAFPFPTGPKGPVPLRSYRSAARSDPCPSLKPDTHDEDGKPYEEKGKKYVVPKVVFSPEWLIESPPPAHTWEEPPIFYDVEEDAEK